MRGSRLREVYRRALLLSLRLWVRAADAQPPAAWPTSQVPKGLCHTALTRCGPERLVGERAAVKRACRAQHLRGPAPAACGHTTPCHSCLHSCFSWSEKASASGTLAETEKPYRQGQPPHFWKRCTAASACPPVHFAAQPAAEAALWATMVRTLQLSTAWELWMRL